MTSLTSSDEPFALTWRGLPAAPAELVAAGHSIVPSVKCDDPHDEIRLRNHCRRRGRCHRPSGPSRRSRVN
jgi:hypothetical protein